jgi:hypothetical protein
MSAVLEASGFGRLGEMSLFALAIILAVLVVPSHANPAQPNSGTQLIELCNRDLARCQQLIGVVIKTGVEAERLPECTSHLDLPTLTQSMLDWWKLYPERAENSVVVAVAYALRALKPC